jgi:hypothetical protein
MIEPLTDFHDLRSNPQIMIRGKATPFVAPRKDESPPDSAAHGNVEPKHLSDEELRLLNELKLRDSAVRDEEEAHARMLGRHAGITRYEYQIGPDGRVYVVNGSVEVDPKFNSKNPEEIRKVLQTIQRAAVSVSNPSQADLNIAASAATKASNVSRQAAMTKYALGVEMQSAQNTASLSTSISNQLNTQA